MLNALYFGSNLLLTLWRLRTRNGDRWNEELPPAVEGRVDRLDLRWSQAVAVLSLLCLALALAGVLWWLALRLF